MRLELRDVALARAGGREALRGISLALGAGELAAVVGPSGAGKTSLLEVAAGALRPSAGGVALAGADPWALPARARRALRRRLFLAPQVPPLPPRQRVVTAVLAGRLPDMSAWASLRSLFFPSALAQANEALAALGMAGHLFDRVDRLSGGERQRVALARVLVSSATLWLLDEPLSALDPGVARQVLGALLAAARARGAAVLASLHQVELARAGFERLIGLSAGVIRFDRPAAEVDDGELARLYALAGDARQAAASDRAAPAPPVAIDCR